MLISGRSHKDLVGCAELLRQSFYRFYDKIPVERDELLDILSKELLEGGTEVEMTWVIGDNQPLAIASIYPIAELRVRQLASTFHLMRSANSDNIPQIQASLLAHQNLVSKFEGGENESLGGTYLARIAVDPATRGTGLGTKLLETLYSENLIDERLTLHVASDNSSAISFYRKIGLDFYDDGEKYFRLMTGKINL